MPSRANARAPSSQSYVGGRRCSARQPSSQSTVAVCCGAATGFLYVVLAVLPQAERLLITSSRVKRPTNAIRVSFSVVVCIGSAFLYDWFICCSRGSRSAVADRTLRPPFLLIFFLWLPLALKTGRRKTGNRMPERMPEVMRRVGAYASRVGGTVRGAMLSGRARCGQCFRPLYR